VHRDQRNSLTNANGPYFLPRLGGSPDRRLVAALIGVLHSITAILRTSYVNAKIINAEQSQMPVLASLDYCRFVEPMLSKRELNHLNTLAQLHAGNIRTDRIAGMPSRNRWRRFAPGPGTVRLAKTTRNVLPTKHTLLIQEVRIYE
jgi:hypothetical protein